MIKFLDFVKKSFLIIRYFYREEITVFAIFASAVLIVLFHVFKKPQLSGNVVYNISISLLAAIIFYFFQVFLPKLHKRKVAQRELNMIINDLIRLITLIIENYYSEEELYEIRFHNNPSKYIFDNIDKVSQYIATNLKLNDVIKFSWNKKRLTFYDEFLRAGNKFNKDYREILLKHGDCLEEKTVEGLEEIYRNIIFVSIREQKSLSQTSINKITIKRLLYSMRDVQEAANRINDFFR